MHISNYNVHFYSMSNVKKKLYAIDWTAPKTNKPGTQTDRKYLRCLILDNWSTAVLHKSMNLFQFFSMTENGCQKKNAKINLHFMS